MTNTTLTLAALGSLLTSVLYLYVGHVLQRRKVSPDARLANNMFVLWWQSLGGLGLLGVGFQLMYMAGRLEIWMYQAYVTFVLLVLFLALWGLQFYLVFLYTGTKRSFVPLGVFYAVLFILTVALIEYVGPPDRIVDNGWQLKTEYLDEETGEYGSVDFPLAFNLGFGLLIVGPAILAAIAYARLYRKTDDRTQKYRIAMVTGAIIVWFGSSLVGTAAQVTTTLEWQLFSRIIGVAGALVILMAYKPPRRLRERLGLRSVDDGGPEGRAAAS